MPRKRPVATVWVLLCADAACAPGRDSFTDLFTKSSSGRNRYQQMPAATTAAVAIMIFRSFIVGLLSKSVGAAGWSGAAARVSIVIRPYNAGGAEAVPGFSGAAQETVRELRHDGQ